MNKRRGWMAIALLCACGAVAPATAQAPAAAPEPDIDLICSGMITRTQQVQDNALSGRFSGQSTETNLTYKEAVQAPQQMRLTLNGAAGIIVYGAGKPQRFTGARVTPQSVVVSYKSFMGLDSNRVTVDQISGEVHSTTSGRPIFAGVCKSAKPVKLGPERSY